MRSLKVICCCFLLFALSFQLKAQDQEIEQLLLNIEKLSQLKSILSDMKTGYTVLSNGYNAVKNIAQGNFSLHEVFLDGLWLVSPEVRKYYKVPQIISDQAALVSAYKGALKRYSGSGVFSASELSYLGKVYGQLNTACLKNLDELLLVMTDSKVRMSDDERLRAIDRIHGDTREQLAFLQAFDRDADVLLVQRQRELRQVQSLKNYYP